MDQDRAASLNVLRELYIVHICTLLPSLVADYLAKRIVADSITISSVTRGKIRTGMGTSRYRLDRKSVDSD